MFWRKLNPRAVEGIREMGAALAAIFVHSVIVHAFGEKDLSWLSFLGALIAAGGMWWFLDWRLRSWLEDRKVWLAEQARSSSIEGSWGSIVTFGDTNEQKISLINILRNEKEINVNGISLKWEAGTAPNGPLMTDGRWHSKEAAYSDSTSTLIYAFDSHTNLESGMCVYTFQRPDSQSAPTGYTGHFIERGKPEVFRVTAKRIGPALKLDDMNSLRAAAKKVYRSLGDQPVASSAAKSSPSA
jgi:hypothetical protein